MGTFYKCWPDKSRICNESICDSASEGFLPFLKRMNRLITKFCGRKLLSWILRLANQETQPFWFWPWWSTQQKHTPLKIKCIRHTSQLAGGSWLSQERGGIRGGREAPTTKPRLHRPPHYTINMLATRLITISLCCQEKITLSTSGIAGRVKIRSVFFGGITVIFLHLT